MKRFCVLATGRSGSTALMDALAVHDDVGLPGKQLKSCDDNELIHHRRGPETIAHYSKLLGRSIQTDDELVRGFYESNEGFQFAGFKAMPGRHKYPEELLGIQEITWLSIRRRDVASTVASFAIAERKGTWRREGEPQVHRYVFKPEHRQRLMQNVRYLKHSSA